MRGFTNIFRVEYSPVNVGSLNLFEDGIDVTPELLVERLLVRRKRDKIKILGDGELSRALNVTAHSFSKSARKKIESAGGKATVLSDSASKVD